MLSRTRSRGVEPLGDEIDDKVAEADVDSHARVARREAGDDAGYTMTPKSTGDVILSSPEGSLLGQGANRLLERGELRREPGVAPAVVNDTCRVVRLNSRTPRERSSVAMLRLTVERFSSSFAAAAVNTP